MDNEACEYAYDIFLFDSIGELRDNDYLIIIPRVFRAGAKINIGVNIFGNQPCDVEVRLYDATKNVVRSRAKNRFEPNIAGTLKLQVSFLTVSLSMA